ncbi:MAG: phosphoenolpyruvate--protein phosphotransferase [Kiritimatiellia bacterium]
MVTVAGLPASRGFVAGSVFLYRSDSFISVPEYEIPLARVASELARYHAARQATRHKLEDLVARLRKQTSGPEADIFENHLLLLDDVTIVSGVERGIRDLHLNAEAALRRTVGEFRAMFGAMKDAYLRERVRDLDDVEKRVLSVLLDRESFPFATIAAPVVLVADDLSPSETVALPRNLILGLATDRGSTTSHVALLARALGIPAVVGLGNVADRVKAGDYVLLDGTNGAVTLNPDAETRDEFQRLVNRERELLALLAEDWPPAGTLKDGTRVDLQANVQPGVPLGCLSSFGVSGIGLYRSEYLWLGSDHEPSEDEQANVYSQAARAVATMGHGARVTFRVLDLGGDKLLRGQRSLEANPFLGCRSIRWLLSHREVFRAQLRAILRASAVGPSAVMYPMVATVEELREANAELRAAMASLRADGHVFDEKLPRGCMIEIPAAALNAVQLAREVDFFSIGTNDLVQYTMAADRGNERVSYLYQPANPAVLRLVDMTVQAARAAGIPVGVCGESASDPVFGVLWVAFGATSLSMSASFVPVLKKILRALTREDLRILATGVRTRLEVQSAEEIYAFCREFLVGRVPEWEEIRSFFTAG